MRSSLQHIQINIYDNYGKLVDRKLNIIPTNPSFELIGEPGVYFVELILTIEKRFLKSLKSNTDFKINHGC